MRKLLIITIYALSTSLIFLFIFPNNVLAQTLTIDPSTGDSNTSFKVSGEGYPEGASYTTCAYKVGGDPNDFIAIGPGVLQPKFFFVFSGTEFALRGGGQTEIKPPGPNEACDPNFQTDSRFKCPNGYPCTLIGPTTAGPYICKATGSTTKPSPTPSDSKNSCGGEAISTAIGCINVKDPNAFIGSVLKFAIGIGGGIAFLLMILGVFQIITSAGNPDRLKAGKELITSALIGLLMIIFSVFLLELIGVKILQIPGFWK